MRLISKQYQKSLAKDKDSKGINLDIKEDLKYELTEEKSINVKEYRFAIDNLSEFIVEIRNKL